MWLAPHFVALDVAGQATQLFQGRAVGSIYQKQSIAVFDKAIRKGRVRFGNGDIYSRHEKALPLIRDGKLKGLAITTAQRSSLAPP